MQKHSEATTVLVIVPESTAQVHPGPKSSKIHVLKKNAPHLAKCDSIRFNIMYNPSFVKPSSQTLRDFDRFCHQNLTTAMSTSPNPQSEPP